MSAPPEVARFLTALTDYIDAANSAGLIEPQLKDITQYIDWKTHSRWPAVRLSIESERVGTIGNRPDHRGVMAVLKTGFAIAEPRSKYVQTELQTAAHSFKDVLLRTGGVFEPGVHIQWRGIEYKLRPRDGKSPVFFAEIAWDAVYRTTFGA